MAANENLLGDAEVKALEEEKEQLLKEQKLLTADIRAMKLEMKRRSGQPAPGDHSSLASLEKLTELSAELTQLQLEEVTFQLVSAENGVSVTRWRVRVVSEEADAEICLEYDTTKDEECNVTCGGLTVVDFSPSLGPLVDAAGDDPRMILAGVYQLGQLAAARRRVLSDVAPANHSEPARLTLPGGKQLSWSIELRPGEDRYRSTVTVQDRKGRVSALPAVLEELLQDQGVEAMVRYVRSLER